MTTCSQDGLGGKAHIPENVRCMLSSDGVLVLIPVFNDWQACRKVLHALDNALGRCGRKVAVLIIDDASTGPNETAYAWTPFLNLFWVGVLRLRRNLGHQRAISIGLAYAEANLPYSAVVVMDGDGEDDPADVPRLLEAYDRENGTKIVFAERLKRSETRIFRFFYFLYRMLHWLLTGHRVRVGNFSVVPPSQVRSLVAMPELWSHYAAAVISSRQAYCTLGTARAPRVDGASKMNFVALVVHGLSAISVFSEVVGVRLLIAACAFVLLALAGIVAVVCIRYFTAVAIPGWATLTSGLLFVALLQAIMFALSFSFTVLSGRRGAGFVPARDFIYFVDTIKTLYNTP